MHASTKAGARGTWLQPTDGVVLQVLRLELDAGGLPGYLFAPRQCVIRKYMRKEEDGVYTIMFEWVPAPAWA
jgi:hypothetical protein